MFIAAHITIARLWTQPICPSTDEWIKKMSYIYTMGYYSAIKNNKIMAFAGKWMKLENIMLSEISQSRKNQRMNDLADKQMMTHNGEWEGGKNGRRRDCIEEKRGGRGGAEGKINRMNQTPLPYVNV